MMRGVAISLAALALLMTASTGAGAVGIGQQCGGFVGIKCNRGLFCEKPPGTCFFADFSGTCARVPRFCPLFVKQVCGCDNKTYTNDCFRERARVSKSHDGACF